MGASSISMAHSFLTPHHHARNRWSAAEPETFRRESNTLHTRMTSREGLRLFGPSGTGGAGVARQTQYDKASAQGMHAEWAATYGKSERGWEMPGFGLHSLQAQRQAEINKEKSERKTLNMRSDVAAHEQKLIDHNNALALEHTQFRLNSQEGASLQMPYSHMYTHAIWNSEIHHPRHPVNAQEHPLYRPAM